MSYLTNCELGLLILAVLFLLALHTRREPSGTVADLNRDQR